MREPGWYWIRVGYRPWTKSPGGRWEPAHWDGTVWHVMGSAETFHEASWKVGEMIMPPAER